MKAFAKCFQSNRKEKHKRKTTISGKTNIVVLSAYFNPKITFNIWHPDFIRMLCMVKNYFCFFLFLNTTTNKMSTIAGDEILNKYSVFFEMANATNKAAIAIKQHTPATTNIIPLSLSFSIPAII